MTIYLSLDKVRGLARELIREKGEGHKSILPGGGSQGCFNVVCFTAEDEYIPAHLLDSKESVAARKDKIARVEGQCLIGSMLIKAGIKPGDILHSGMAGHSISGMLEWVDENDTPRIMVSRMAKEWMIIAQRTQDGGSTWGEAFSKADASTLSALASENSIL